MSTAIEWTDVTDNIIAVEGGGWWCRKISPGCANCYAEKINKNAFFGGNMADYTGAPPNLILRREILAGWSRQRNPKKHFVASMTDVFGDWVPQEWIDEILTAMMLAEKQTFQVLTKRPDVANERIRDFLGRKCIAHLTENIWVGTSVENKECDIRIPQLLEIPAKVRFISCEPLLGPIDLRRIEDHYGNTLDALTGDWGIEGRGHTGPSSCRIHWVICGGESGPKARPMHPDWARSLRDQCQAANVPFLFKQWGEFSPCDPPVVTNVEGKLQATGTFRTKGQYVECPNSSQWLLRVGKKTAGRILDGREWNEFPTGKEGA